MSRTTEGGVAIDTLPYPLHHFWPLHCPNNRRPYRLTVAREPYAKLFVRDKLTLTNGKSSALDTYFYQGDWWQWNKAFYEK
jgi:hypothetical protein